MLSDIQSLIEILKGVPTLSVWVLVGYLVYKVAIVGSIYGVVRFAIDKAHHYYVTRATLPPEAQEVSLRDKLAGITITSGNTMDELLMQLRRVVGKNIRTGSAYIHTTSVDWLRSAIDAKEQEDEEKFKEQRATVLLEEAIPKNRIANL